ncbi:MAG: hypothetical protein KUG76_05370 [Gammaproteobacteria bacterium]|nr:hypothetical protein [Gammaproteobacteria bacterium]
MKKLVTKSLLATIVVASPLLFSLDVSADDGKIYSGADCERHSGSTSYNHSSGIFRNNSTTQNLTVVCPVTKDVFAHNIKSGWIKLVDLSTTENFKCSMHSKNRNANGSWTNFWSGNAYSSGYGTHTQKKSFSGMGHVSSNSNYYVTCTIPKRNATTGSSYIVSYSATENS